MGVLHRCASGVLRRWRALSIGALITLLLTGSSGFNLSHALVAAPSAFISGFLIDWTFALAGWSKINRRTFIAYTPLGAALLTGLVAHVYTRRIVGAGSLNDFYGIAAPLLGLLLISSVLEARRLASHDPWLRAFRGWWTLLICIGILFALMAVTPGHGHKLAEEQFVVVWGALGAALTAMVVVGLKPPDSADHKGRVTLTGSYVHTIPDSSKTTTRTGEPPTRA